MSLAESVIQILEPLIGHSLASTCVRATALGMGKTSEDLAGDDVAALASNVRYVLAPVAPATTVDRVLGQIQRLAS